MIITIDGPAVSGKGTLARYIAREKDFYYLETGLFYRSVGYYISQNYSREQVKQGALDFEKIKKFTQDIEYSYQDSAGRIAYNNRDITSELRTKEIEWFTSHISKFHEIRRAIKQAQIALGEKYNLVVEGRDCGSAVYPHAEYKFFLTARLERRAERLVADTTRNNKNYTIAQAREDILLRDIRDIARDMGALVVPDGAIIIDNSNISFDQTCELLLSYI